MTTPDTSRAPTDVARYYSANAQTYFERTVNVDMSSSREVLTRELAPGASILDAGCGSGRDSKAFLEEGFEVISFDGCPELCALASAHTGQPVLNLRFDELKFSQVFDGVYASASLLHLDDEALTEALRRLLGSLKPGGMLFASFKHGFGLRIDEATGRLFNDMNDARVRRFIAAAGGKTMGTRVDADTMGRGNDWLAVLATTG